MSNIDGKRSLADKAYSSRENRQYLRNRKIKSGIMYKALKNNPLAKLQTAYLS